MRNILLTGVLALLQLTVFAQKSDLYLYKAGKIDSVYSSILKEQRSFYVQFPSDFDPSSDRTYPVTFILDGEVFLPTASIVQDYYSGGYFPEMILIGISNHEHRTRDFTPTEIKTKYGMPFKEETGGAEKFLQFIKDELIPFVEKKYPVTNYRTLIGHSYGGLFAIYTMLNNPDLFTNYLAIDPSLDWDNQIMIKQASNILSNQEYKGKSLYMSLSGQLHMQNPNITIDNVMSDTTDFTLFARSNIEFSKILKQNSKSGLNLTWEFFPNDLHGTIPLPSIRNGMIALFKWFQMEKTDRINSPDTPKEELNTIIEYRAQKLKDHFGYTVPPYPEDLMNMSGYMNMDMEQMEKAKMFFELTIKYYPNSANAYDSMAEFYMNQKDFQRAIDCESKAYQLSKSDYHKNKLHELEDMK